MYLTSWWYDLQFLRYSVWQIEISNYESFFALLPTFPIPSQKPEESEFWKNKNKKKNDGDISILQMYNKKPRIGSWAILLPFYTFNNLENQNFEQNENHLTQVMSQKSWSWCMISAI